MSTLKDLLSKTLLFHLWQEFRVRYRFKYVLPKVTEATLDGIRLDLTKMSLKVRNRLLMGIYEAHEKRMCRDFLTADDSVVEIGSAIGFIGLFCQKNIGIRNYYLFEANPETLRILHANYELNGIAPTAANLALAPQDGPLDLEVESDFWENSILPPAGGVSAKTVRVPGASFGTLLRRAGRAFNVLIVDVEGAEQFIDPAEIPDTVNKVIIELHPERLGPEKTYGLIGGFLQRGFHVAREDSGTYAFIRRTPRPPRAARPGPVRRGALAPVASGETSLAERGRI